MMKRMILTLSLLAFSIAGCDKAQETASSATEAAGEAAAAAGEAAGEAAEGAAEAVAEAAEELVDDGPTAEDLPMPEDFDDEMAAEITDENYANALSELEAELDAEDG